VLVSAVVAAQGFDGEVVGQVTQAHARLPIPRFGVATPSRNVEGHAEAMALYAGTGVGEVREVQPAAHVVADLVSMLD
jgi:hypothetical protein